MSRLCDHRRKAMLRKHGLYANLCKLGSLSSASFSGSRRGKRRLSLCFLLAPKGAVAQTAPLNPSGKSGAENSPLLDVQFLHELRIRLDELEAGFDFLAHEIFNEIIQALVG